MKKEISLKLCDIYPTVKHVDFALNTNQSYIKDKFEISNVSDDTGRNNELVRLGENAK